MIKFTGESKDGRTVYFFGLSRGNIDRLTAGQPIKVNLKDMGGPAVDIAILFGETERILFNSLKEQGLIPPEIGYREAEIGTTEVTRIKRESTPVTSTGLPSFHYDMQRRCLTRCQADDDGDCHWADCPQRRGNRRDKNAGHCPLDSGENRRESE